MDNNQPVSNEESEDVSFLEEESPCECAAPAPEETEEKDALPDVEVIGVHFRGSGKNYYFDPNGMTVKRDEHVIVETARGTEYGVVSLPNRMVPARTIVPPLRPVLRRATDEDEAHYIANKEKEAEAFNICLEKIEALRLDMKLVDVEYTFDNTKLLFYFTADGRIDFRELVKHLASVFRTRIELRQIGIRDEAKMMGGLGVCGRPFCCKTFLPDFVQVSIKMAKEQSLSLNSSKISGSCGRLMCCLRYEYDTYVEEIAKLPRVDSVVSTPDGDGIVTEITPLAGICKVRLLGQSFDQAPKAYTRDDVTFKGIYKKDLPPQTFARPEKNDEDGKSDRGQRHSRRSEIRVRKPERREHVYPENDEQPSPLPAESEEASREEPIPTNAAAPEKEPAAQENKPDRGPRPGGQRNRGRHRGGHRGPRPPKKDGGGQQGE